MSDSLYGSRDKAGHWHPKDPISFPPVLVWPVQLMKLIKWLPRYIFPFNAFYVSVSILLWVLAISHFDCSTISVETVAFLFFLNCGVFIAYTGGLHLLLYVVKYQDIRFKFNVRWPSRTNKEFLFGNQTIDNVIWDFASGVPLLTAYEILLLWAFSSGLAPMISFGDHPIYFVLLLFAIPTIHEIHFYAIHRLIHTDFLYQHVHRFHHNNVNPGPWSGLAMHPAEHLLYFSGLLIYFVVPAHPIHMLFHMTFVLLAPAQGHSGFERIAVGDKALLDTRSYAHYLHHKYFECNYSDGIIRIDRFFGTFHDGSPEDQQRMDKRLKERAARLAAKQTKKAANGRT